MFPVSDHLLNDLRRIIDATFAGRIEELGGSASPTSASSRIQLDDDTIVAVGSAAPGPWTSERIRKYMAYRVVS